MLPAMLDQQQSGLKRYAYGSSFTCCGRSSAALNKLHGPIVLSSTTSSILTNRFFRSSLFSILHERSNRKTKGQLFQAHLLLLQAQQIEVQSIPVCCSSIDEISEAFPQVVEFHGKSSPFAGYIIDGRNKTRRKISAEFALCQFDSGRQGSYFQDDFIICLAVALGLLWELQQKGLLFEP